MDPNRIVSVKLFSFLYQHMAERGLPSEWEIEVPAEGRTGLEIARELALPEDLIEAVFINGTVHPLDAHIRGGDRIAFVPVGVPGPYRVLLGIVKK
jgi:hypothetical protein